MMGSMFVGLLLAGGIGLLHLPAEASGSIGTGAGKISPRAAYSQGKALTFDVLICDTCPIQRDEFDRDRAQSLTTSLEAAYEGNPTDIPDDEAVVSALCSGEAVQDEEECKLRMELVHYFLSRRYKL